MVKDVIAIKPKIRLGRPLQKGDINGIISAQSAIDVTKDISDLMDGKKITTIAEMEEKLRAEEEAMEKKLKGDAQEAYTY